MNMNHKIEYIKKTKVSKDAWDLHFVKPKGFRYDAGQFIEAKLEQEHPDDRGQKRWFTLSSSPTENTIDITTRKLPKHSSFKDSLFGLKKGDKLNITGPDGSFVLPTIKSNIVWIAGGIGITPFRSQIKYLLDNKIFDYDIVLFYGNRTPEDNVCRDLISDYSSRNKDFKYIEVLSEDIPRDWTGETGYIDEKLITKYVSDITKKHFYISGPGPMVDAIKAKLTNMNIDDKHVHTDWFPGYSDMF